MSRKNLKQIWLKFRLFSNKILENNYKRLKDFNKISNMFQENFLRN